MPIGNTDLTATKNALIVSLVQRELIAKSVLMSGALKDASAFAVKGAKSISVPRHTSFSVEDRATTVQATLANITFAVDTIVLDQMSTVSYLVDPQDGIESAVDVEAEAAAAAGRAHAKNFDELIIAGLEADSTATTTAGAISKAIFLEMRQLLLTAQADPQQLVFLCGPDSEAVLLGISEFVDASVYGSAVIPSGVLGRLYGVEVRMSTQVAANRFYMFDKEGYGFAIQQALNMGERAAPEYGSKAVLKTVDMKWGHDKLLNGAVLRKDNN